MHAKKGGRRTTLLGTSKTIICGLFQDYIQNLAEACGHHHGTGKKKKKDKKKRKKDDVCLTFIHLFFNLRTFQFV